MAERKHKLKKNVMKNISKVIVKNTFERFTQKGIASALCMCLLLAGCFTSCSISGDNVEDENRPVYVWSEGQKYYYAFDEKIPLYEAEDKIVLGFDENFLSDLQQYLQENVQIQNMELSEYYHYFILTMEKPNLKELRKDFSKQVGVKSVNPMYLIYGGTEAVVTDEIVVQFKNNVSQKEIDAMYKKFNIEVRKITELFLILSVSIELDPLEVANAIQKSGLANYSHPNFFTKNNF